jgi:transcriptional regulator with XRE-family HTH domain
MNGILTQRRFGELLRKYRVRRGATQRQLADLSTVSVRAIRDLELGHSQHPRRDTVRLIAAGLGLGDRERARLEAAAGWQPSTDELREWFDAARAVPPSALSPLVGRHAETRALLALLATGGQLVTVTGPCGVGKTRTALAVAHHLHETDHMPVLWHTPAAAPGSWRPTMGADELSTLLRAELDALVAPIDVGVDELATLIGDRPALLVLDDVATVGEAVLALLRDCPGLRILATARHALGVQCEHAFPLAPLAVPPDTGGPSVAGLAAVESVQLFARYAVLSQPSFTLTAANTPVIAEICRLLDGIPAALEAAAGWLLVSSPDELLDHVRTDPFDAADGRIADLRDAIGRALARLSGSEAGLLDDLTGSWTVTDAAELSGRPPIACARLARRFLTLGLIHQETDRPTHFHTLELARWLATTTSGTAQPTGADFDRLDENRGWQQKAMARTSAGHL